MQLNDLKPAWKAVKCVNDLCTIDANEILFIIEQEQQSPAAKVQRVVLQVVMFTAVAMVCQSG